MHEKPKLLVVDDEDVVLRASERILSAEGFPIRTAASAENALEVIDEWRPDVLLADLKMPGLSGIELMRQVHARFPHLISITMTGYANVDHVIVSLKNGAFDFLPKPFTFDELIGCVDRASRLHRARESDVRPTTSTDFSAYLALDWHTWARVEEDETACLGITEDFLSTVSGVKAVTLPSVNTLLQQGGVLTRVTSEDGLAHRAWCALGGRVTEVNEALHGNPHLLMDAPFAEGWIARVIPVNLRDERKHLRQLADADRDHRR